MIKIWHFGDAHGNHRKLEVPEDIDIAIFSGDAGTYRDAAMNEPIVRDFLDWFYSIDVPYKIMIAGNHDSSIERRHITPKKISDYGIEYLEDDLTLIEVKGEAITIYGSPWVPTFGTWSYMKARHKIHKVWDQIPPNVDILVTHGPPQGILDTVEGHNGLESAGCANLRKQVIERIKPKYHLFGHIHNHMNQPYTNAGIKTIPNCKTIFSNGSVVEDGKLNTVYFNGNIIQYGSGN